MFEQDSIDDSVGMEPIFANIVVHKTRLTSYVPDKYV